MASEFSRVQRTLNDRVDALESELERVRAEATAAKDSYQITTNELVNQVRRYQRARAEARTEAKVVRAMEDSQPVRENPIDAAGTDSVEVSTLPEVRAGADKVSFDSIFDEVGDDLDNDQTGDGDEGEEGGTEDVDSETSECPLVVSGMHFMGLKRLEGRRESKYWKKAMEVDLENPTDRMMVVQVWAHVPPEMGWYFDDFGLKQIRLNPGQKKQKIKIPYDPEYRLFLLVEKKVYSFPFEPADP